VTRVIGGTTKTARDTTEDWSMKTGLDHLQVNIRPENVAFYRELMTFLGWHDIFAGEGFFGMGGSTGSLWFISQVKDVENDYDGPGVNHIGISAESEADVDAVIAYLRERGIEMLFETPRHRPIPGREGHTYYQVMFESPDRVLFEVQYSGPKSA
jgi:catechol 2,3-dioxygenase-like lactoylglutathione lyase family enzyme